MFIIFSLQIHFPIHFQHILCPVIKLHQQKKKKLSSSVSWQWNAIQVYTRHVWHSIGFVNDYMHFPFHCFADVHIFSSTSIHNYLTISQRSKRKIRLEFHFKASSIFFSWMFISLRSAILSVCRGLSLPFLVSLSRLSQCCFIDDEIVNRLPSSNWALLGHLNPSSFRYKTIFFQVLSNAADSWQTRKANDNYGWLKNAPNLD